MAFKAGFVNIIGKPNAGKSTLMNHLVGEQLAIVTPKAQTTRHRIMGITTTDGYQVIYSDTPGLLKPRYKLQEKMMDYVEGALEDADIILFVVDLNDKEFEFDGVIDTVKAMGVPIILLLNKADRATKTRIEEKQKEWSQLLPEAEQVLITATRYDEVAELEKRLVELLPEGEPFYPEDTLTDRPMRFYVSEMIREKIMMNYHKEIPYSVQVEIEEYKESEEIIRIRALIYVMRRSQKGIIIGHKGERLKKVGIESRQAIERFVGKQVHLELYVKVAENWRDNERRLSGYGYKS